MPAVDAVVETKIQDTFRVAAVKGKFDLPEMDSYKLQFKVNLPIEDKPWRIGAIVGASGTGKSTVARSIFEPKMPGDLAWGDGSILEDFPKTCSIEDIASSLISVGFSSYPLWLLPYRVLSVGEQFRVACARVLLESKGIVCLDEYTSVVDRTVARAISMALNRWTVKANRQLVTVSCHKDFLPWLQPDWVLDMDTREFLWRPEQRRPGIQLQIFPTGVEAWPSFSRYHYLTTEINRTAKCFVVGITFEDEGIERAAAFWSSFPAMGMHGWERGHRFVVLPDFQGVGIGNAITEAIAEYYWTERHLRFRSTISSPNLVQHRVKHPEAWRLTKNVHQAWGGAQRRIIAKTNWYIPQSAGRLTTSWEYVPLALRDQHGVAPANLADGERTGVELGESVPALAGLTGDREGV